MRQGLAAGYDIIYICPETAVRVAPMLRELHRRHGELPLPTTRELRHASCAQGKHIRLLHSALALRPAPCASAVPTLRPC